MKLLRRVFILLVITFLLVITIIAVAGFTDVWRMDSELKMLGPYREKIDWLQHDAVVRWTFKIMMLAAIPFLLYLIYRIGNMWNRWKNRKPVVPPVTVVPMFVGANSTPASSNPHKLALFALVGIILIVAVYNGVRGYLDHSRAAQELELLVPFYEGRVAKLRAAKAHENEMRATWQNLNNQYWALLVKDDNMAKQFASQVAEQMKLLAEAQTVREFEEGVVERIRKDLMLVKRMAGNSAPWRLLNDVAGE